MGPFKTHTHLLNDHVMNHLIKKRFKLRGESDRQTVSQGTDLQRDGTKLSCMEAEI